MKLYKKEAFIGRAKQRRFFDLGIHNSSGSGFLALLIGLMTFLAVLALATSFALSAMAERWSHSLSNQITIEIPATNTSKGILSTEDIDNITTKAGKILSRNNGVESVEIKTRKEVEKLVEPWLGEDLDLRNVPLPGLITVTLKETDEHVITGIRNSLKPLSGSIRIDTHESWLSDLLSFTSALQLAIFLIGSVIGATTIIAVAGGVRSKLSIHYEEVEILHLMGAFDTYIAKQFQVYAFLIALKGSVIGAFSAAAVLFLTALLSNDIAVTLLPDFELSTTHMVFLCLIPLMAAILAAIAARKTVMKDLLNMV